MNYLRSLLISFRYNGQEILSRSCVLARSAVTQIGAGNINGLFGASWCEQDLPEMVNIAPDHSSQDIKLV